MQIDQHTELLFRLNLPARPERLALVRAVTLRMAEQVGCSTETAQKLVIAINEVCMNIIQHAYQGDVNGLYVMEVKRNAQALYFRFEDSAHPVDLDKVKPRELEDIRPGGLGVYFIREIMDSFEMGHLQGGKGNYLEMMKNIE